MLPPLLEIYVIWHPEDSCGADVADQLIDHFHGTPFAGLIGGAIEVFVRSVGWRDDSDAPRPLPLIEELPYGVPGSALTVFVPVLGKAMARAVEEKGPWREYMEVLRTAPESQPDEACILPVRLLNASSEGVLAEAYEAIQAITPGNGLCRDISQAIAQFAQPETKRLKVFLSHTKRGGPSKDPAALVQRVRELILDTKLQDFFDAHDLLPGTDWSAVLLEQAATSALLAIRTDQYASREWCQKEVAVAKRAGMPAVILDALSSGEERGSFLMDNLPRIPLHDEISDSSITRALDQLVDECLKRALWDRQRQLAEELGPDIASWWAAHAPEPVTFSRWLAEHQDDTDGDEPIVVLHPDPPLGPDEMETLEEFGRLCGLKDRLKILTPRGLAVRGG